MHKPCAVLMYYSIIILPVYIFTAGADTDSVMANGKNHNNNEAPHTGKQCV